MFFLDFKTNRIHAKMRELTIAQAITICEVPGHLQEQATSLTLDAIIAETNLQIKEWTAQERIAALAHYHIAIDQNNAQLLSDYQIDKEYSNELYEFKHEDKTLYVQHLTTEYLESIERIIFAGRITKDIQPITWTTAGMAAQIRGKGEDDLKNIDDLLTERAKTILQLTDSEFATLYQQYCEGIFYLEHIFKIWFNADGLIVIPREEGDDVNNRRTPIRFQPISIITSTTKRAIGVIEGGDS